MCSPAPRDAAASEGLWKMIRRRRAGCRFVRSQRLGLRRRRRQARARRRCAVQGHPQRRARAWARACRSCSAKASPRAVSTPAQFVRLTATNPARLFGLYPRKGTIAPGADADIVLWDPKKKVTITNELMQHMIDYTPYEGLEVTGWPVMPPSAAARS